MAALVVAPLLTIPASSSKPADAEDVLILGDATYQVAPGLSFQIWTQVANGIVNNGYALRASIDEPTLQLRYLGGSSVHSRYPVTSLVSGNGAVAGVNASFFDISGSGGPLGTAVVGGRVLYASTDIMPAIVIGANGVPDLQTVQMEPITNTGWAPLDGQIKSYNNHIAPETIGLYDASWLTTTGKASLGKTCCTMREVVVNNGIVVSNSDKLSTGKSIAGQVLVAQGLGAKVLAGIPVGTALNLNVTLNRTGLSFALSSPLRLLTNGDRGSTLSTSGTHPRTAFGYDEDLRQLMLVVVDGRSENSGGLTENGIASLMQRLGAEDAINLDGGGSSTMVARFAGAIHLWNSPSDGTQRSVPNGLGFVSSAPDPNLR